LGDRLKIGETLHSIVKQPTELHASDFEGMRLKSHATVPALFVANWCGFSRRFYPEFETAMKNKGIEWAMVDISDMDDPLWETLDIGVVPTVLVFKNGEIVSRKDGVLGRGLSTKAIDEVIEELRS
jgi:thioredoxin 1